MQFHLNGFKGSDDPSKLLFEGDVEPDFQSKIPTEVDVLIVGAGPAGLLLGAYLARFPDITTRIIEQRHGPLQQGQADGLQCRTIEVFETFGFSEKVLKEAYWVNETTFWSPTEDGQGLRRTGRIRDTEAGLSEFPHVILNQARLHGLWLDAMKWSPTRLEPSYGRTLTEMIVPESGPVELTIQRVDDEDEKQYEHVKAKYVVGCDGSRSFVRSKLGLEMKGDFANQAWGVLDALVVSDFPDLRLKTVIHSAMEGSILIIPREGGYLCRFYIELDKLKQDERVASKNVTSAILIERAQRIFKPYTFDVMHLAYCGKQDIRECSSQAMRAIRTVQRQGYVLQMPSITADHHKQGMNVSMNDTFNLGWKLSSVLHRQAHPNLLHTYSQERQEIAQKLIDFDRRMAKLFAAKPKVNADANDEDSVDPAVFQDFFTQQGRFMSGLATVYAPSIIISASTTYQHLAKGYRIGERFHSAQVLRLADAKPIHLGHEMKADGRWRLIIFGSNEDPLAPDSILREVCDRLYAEILPEYTPKGADIDSVIDVRAVFPQSRKTLAVSTLPLLLLPAKGRFGLRDYEKVFTDEESYGFGFGNIYEARGIDKEKGCMIAVRPDQYVSAVLPLSMDGCSAVGSFFAQFMVSQAG